MSKVITGTGSKNKTRVVVKKAGHPAAFRKICCPKCRLGFCVESNIQKGLYTCRRCGRNFGNASI